MYSLFLALLFVVKLRWPKEKSVFNYVEAKYGHDELLLLRCYERSLKKHNRLVLDLKFLGTCQLFNMTPTFLNFRLSKPELKSAPACKSFKRELLEFEITGKHKLIRKCKGNISDRLSPHRKVLFGCKKICFRRRLSCFYPRLRFLFPSA